MRPGTGLPTSTDWYGFGMNVATLMYNIPSGTKHLFQTNGTEVVYINSTGITTPGNLTTAICIRVDATGNSLVIGINDYLVLGVDCYGNVSLTGNLVCNNIKYRSYFYC